MEPMGFMAEAYNQSQRATMLKVAHDSILYGLENAKALKVKVSDFDDKLQKPRACFVTLNLNHKLRGCIGHLEAIQPLITNVAQNAFNAAFHDPRFAALTMAEFSNLEIHISVLTEPSSIYFNDEADLLSKIKPGVDGLILESNHNRGTFLPSVWDSLPDKSDFLQQLKLKAGLPANYWSDNLKVSRYHTESFATTIKN